MLRAVVDGGAEVCVINSKILEGLEKRSIGKIRLRGIVGKPVEANLTNLRLQLADCTHSKLSFPCASCDEWNEDLVLTTDIVDKLYEQKNCNILSRARALALGTVLRTRALQASLFSLPDTTRKT